MGIEEEGAVTLVGHKLKGMFRRNQEQNFQKLSLYQNQKGDNVQSKVKPQHLRTEGRLVFKSGKSS